MTLEELTTVTRESQSECLRIVKNARFGEMYQPQGLDYTILFLGTNGGPNWGGASYDPVSNTLFVNSMDVGQVLKMVKAPEGELAYLPRGITNGRFWDSNLYPCQQPPWGTLTAINLNT